MAGTDTPVERSPRSLAGAFDPSAPSYPEPPPAHSSSTPPPTTFVLPVEEAVTLSTLHTLLAQVLAQTNALWQAQASTNRILDEFRRSVPAPQENAEVDERLRRVETLVATLAQSHPVDPSPPAPPGQETRAAPSAYPGRSVPPSVSEPPVVPDTGGPPSGGAAVNPSVAPGPTLSTQGTTRDIEGVLPDIRPVDHADQSIASIATAPGQIPSLEPQGGRVLAAASFPLSSEKAEEQAVYHPVSSTSQVTPPSGLTPSDTLSEPRELLEQVQVPLIAADQHLGQASTVESLRNTASTRAVGPSGVQQIGILGIEKALEEVQRLALENRELLQVISDARAGSGRQNEEIVSAIRVAVNEEVLARVQGCLGEFSRDLNAQIRVLSHEVNNLQEEQQKIHDELRQHMSMQSTRVPRLNGEQGPSRSYDNSPPSPGGNPLSARRASRTGRSLTPDGYGTSSWATWQPNPLLPLTPPPVEPTLWVPDRGTPGLFGPRSPRDSPRDLVGAEAPHPPHSNGSPWAAWQLPPAETLDSPVPPPIESAWTGWDDFPPPVAPLEESREPASSTTTVPAWVTRAPSPDPAPTNGTSPPDRAW